MGFSRQEYWSGLPFPAPGDLRDSLGKNTGVGCHFLLQGISLTQELNPCLFCLLHWQVDPLPLTHLGSPLYCNSYC